MKHLSWKLPVVLACTAATLAGCSSDEAPPAMPALRNGVFADHAVSGLQYDSDSQTGLTNRQGEFRWRGSEGVAFRIGDILLGDAPGADVLTPVDIGNAQESLNIARLLQTLDVDCDASNGIEISVVARDAGAGVSLDFDQSAEAFGADPEVQAYVDEAKGACPGLIGAAEAQATLQQTLDYQAAHGGRVNRLPTADAGPDRQVVERRAVTVPGSGSDEDGQIVGYAWTQIAGPAVALSGAATPTLAFTTPSISSSGAQLSFRLRVTDDGGATADDIVHVFVQRNPQANDPPLADAGLDLEVNEGDLVTLAGSGSDPEDGAGVTYRWTQDATDPVQVTLADAGLATARFTAPLVDAPLALHFTLTVRDTEGAESSDRVIVAVRDLPPANEAPVADAGPDQVVDEETFVQLDGGSSADADGAIAAWAWTQQSGPAVTLTGADGPRPSFTAPRIATAQTLVFRLTVTDDRGAQASDDVAVAVLDGTVVSIAGGELAEGNTGTKPLGFVLTLSEPQSEAVTVNYGTVDGTARAGLDYVATSGTVTFAPGATRQDIAVDIKGDLLDENDETFTVVLSGPANAALGNHTATGTIRDDDRFVFQVGTGQANHDPKGRVCIGGGTNCSRAAGPEDGPDWIRDELLARAMAITGANGETFLLVTTTNIGYFLAYKAEQSGLNGIYDVRLRIAQATGVPSTNVTVVSDHSHNGPDTIGIWGGVSAEYMKITADAVVSAAVQAYAARKPAVLRVAAVNQNGDRLAGVPGLDSSYDLPPGNDTGRGNPYNEFRLLTADDAETGARILTFVNYAPHATVTNGDRIGDRYRLTGDWTAWAPQEAEATYGGMGVAAVGALGGTDWNKSGNVEQKEAEARARLRRLMAEATARLRPVQGDSVQVESTFIREQITQPVLLLNYKPGVDHNNPDVPTHGSDVRIDRSVLPPFLTGTVVGTYVSAARIGDLFLSTFPGEPFGELDHAIQDEGRVQGVSEHFLLGGANDFFGYMVKKQETYEQTLRTGTMYLGGCPLEEQETQLGIRPAGEGACADHWTLMVSPTIGSHIVCTLQDAADRLGFTTANRDAECPALTALDGLAPPPESDSPVAGLSSLARASAVQQARELAQQCRSTAAPAQLCDALAQGAREAETRLGAPGAGETGGQARAGVAVKDASWHLGASAGQFAASGAGIARDRGFDPYGHSTRKVGSDTLGTRITTRALVVEGANGERIAIVSNDLYLPNDLLHRRVAQLLAEHDAAAAATGGVVTRITDRNLATTSSHSHTSPFYSTPGWGTWIFQDVMDLRFYEYMARQMADAVIEAAAAMKPVRMGGATVHANDIQAHTYDVGVARDGTPAGQPRDYTTQAVTVVSFDDISGGAPKPLANWVIFGVHPEWVWGEEIVNGDITHAVMRMLDRETGAVTLWSQRETGSSGPHKDTRVHAPERRREFQESNFAGYDRAARYLTDSIKRALSQLATNQPERPDQFAPYQTGFEVAYASQRVAPPVTRPYPGISNCNTDRALEEGDVGTVVVPGLPDCSYDAAEALDPVTEPFWEALPMNPAELASQLGAAGVPIPTSYSGTSFTAVQETAAVHLQAFKLGTIAATLSPNEQFTSQALNIESRLDKVPDNLWMGFDFACVALKRGLMAPMDIDADPKVAGHCARQNARYPEARLVIPGDVHDEDFARARAQIHNDARGWELDPVYAAQNRDPSSVQTLGGEAEPEDIAQIKGNFTHEEFPEHGYDLVVSVGMANDYWGYMAEYREYRAHSNAYRKALNALGPHGADFVATRLTRMAASLNGASAPLPFNPLDAAYQAESHRADTLARTLGELARAYTAAYELTLPPDGGAPRVTQQPADEVKRFSAAVLKFVGGSNYTDMPQVRVERLVEGAWQTYGTQEGEVQLQLQFLPSAFSFSEEIPGIGEGLGVALPDPQALALWRAGQFEWVWTATFEAFVSELDNLGARPGITPAGTYRFVVNGQHRGLMSFPNAAPYELVSETFEVKPWDGITVEDLRVEDDGRVSFRVGPVNTFTTFRSGAATDAGTVTLPDGLVVGPVDYPDSYEGGIDWLRNERQLLAGGQQYCGRCSFRPWADSAQLAVSAIPVTVNGEPGALTATRVGDRWVTDGRLRFGDEAFVPAGVIADEYGEKNGAASATVRREQRPADADGDGVPDAADQCPDEPGPANNHGCPVITDPGAIDSDRDGRVDAVDNCASTPNADQADADGDGIGDACDAIAGSGGLPPPPDRGLVGCLLTQDPGLCQSALESLAGLQGCSFDDTGINCAYEIVHDALGGDTAAGVILALFEQCAASPAAPACEAIRSGGGGAVPDRLPVASEPVARGDLVYAEGDDVVPSRKTVDGAADDWMGEGTRFGGTDRFEFGEHIYTDFLFDAFGADDGDDARRWAALAALGQVSTRTERVDALQQAAGDQLDVPQPAGSSADHYGDAANREDGTDLAEVRWAADEDDLYFLARTTKLIDASSAAVIILADVTEGAGMQGLDTGLSTAMFDHAVILEAGGGRIVNLANGASVPLSGRTGRAAVGSDDNAFEARIPRVLLERADGKLRVAVLSARRSGGAYVPANVAYRYDEPVTIYSERAQAFALYARSVDPFARQIAVADLVRGRTQSARPGPGYHERQFTSGANISVESDTENGRLQPYGLFVPRALARNEQGQARLTFWTHYRGGKAHSGAAWTPRLIHQLGEEQGNLVVTPRARGTSTWYTTRAHQDFFEVFADVAGTKRLNQYASENLPAGHGFTADGLFEVDPARIYISGYSMGGYATYLFAGLYPDLFAAGYSTSGAVTQGAWTGIGPDAGQPGTELCALTAPEEMPEVGGGTPCFIEANSGRANAQLNYRILDNTRHVPITIHHGTNDELALTPGALRMAERFATLGYRHDLTLFLGYEHFTQAIVDEWADGARYLNRFARPANPRVVTYKVVPALVKAVNEVQLNGLNGNQPFRFKPDGAYWIDDLAVRSGADGSDPSAYGLIEAESGRLAAEDYVAVPRTGATVDPADPYASTPVVSPGNHSTPYVREGLDWQAIGEIPGDANTFRVRLENLSRATLDLARMGFAGHFGAPVEGAVESLGGGATLTLKNVRADMTACVNATAVANVASGGAAIVAVPEGVSTVKLLPGHGAGCGGSTPPPPEADGLPRPGYAALCGSLGIAEASPLCAQLGAVADEMQAQCAGGGGPEGFCTLTGGNLHAVVEGCYEASGGDAAEQRDGAPLPLCRAVDAFVQGAAAYCRQPATVLPGEAPTQVCAMVGGVLVSPQSIERYEASWTHRALALQNRLGYRLPLAHNTVLHTHNSFNATDDNTPPTLSGSDYNQYHDIPAQLRMDIRAIEMDVHWMPGRDGSAATLSHEPMLCHGQGGDALNAGCTNEKPLREGLAEFRAWLDRHPEEVVLLYIEDDLRGTPFDESLAHATTADVVQREIGDLVFRPADHGSTCANSQSAKANGSTSWLGVSRQQVLDAGKQVLLLTESCAGGQWDALFHQMNGGNWVQGTQSSYAGFGYETCRMPDDAGFMGARRGKFTRVWEDATVVTATAGGGAPASVTPAVMRELMRCGLNLPGVDRLLPQDGRLEAAVWSWAPGEPATSAAKNCAALNSQGRFVAADCAQPRPYACVANADPDAWLVMGSGAWAGGVTACPAGYRFSVPGNGYANERLKASAAGREVWLNYSDAQAEGAWTGDGTGAAPGAAPAADLVAGEGLAGLLGRFATALGEALVAALDGDLNTATRQFGAALSGAGGEAAELPQSIAEGDAQDLASADRLRAEDEASCAPANASWTAYGSFIGSLHEHSGYSDGRPGTEPRDYYKAARDHGLDFMGGTEHSDNADVPPTVTDACLDADAFQKCLVADNDDPADAFRKWDASREQARAASDAWFTAFRGFEWTSDRFGHINVFFSRHDWNAKTTDGYAGSMASFWAWFTTRPELGGGGDGLGVFNHPGREDQLHAYVPDPAYAFNDFEYRPEADLRMVGIETFGKDNDTYDVMNGAPAGGWYAYALDKGWHVGPVGAEDEHSNGAGLDWAKPSRAKTILIARDRSEAALREALFARRFYAVAHGHNDLRLSFTADGAPMGARLARPTATLVRLEGAITAGAGVQRVEIVTAGGAVAAAADGTSVSLVVAAGEGERWYYFRALRDGRPVAYSAPVWIRAGGDYPVCGEWLAGDLHVHSTYSHDSWGGPDEVAGPLSSVVPGVLPGDDEQPGPEEYYTLGHTVERQFRIAAARGLDYLAITDHNNVKSQSDPGFGAHGVLALPSYEKSLAGHAQMHGARRIYDAAQPLQAIANALRADGGVFQINHPAGESVDWHADADWAQARDGSYAGDVVPDTVEVWNISWLWQPPAPSANSLDDALRYWEGWLDHGARVAATGGSDNHYVATTAIQGNGQPTTWVYATERSVRGVLEGMRAGRTTISHQPPLLAPPRVVLDADRDGDGVYETALGGEVPAGTALRARVSNAAGTQLRIISGGGVVAREAVPAFTPEFELRFTLPAGRRWVRAEVVEPDGVELRREAATVCDAAAIPPENGFPEDTRTTYCRNRLGVLALSSALYLRP